MLGPDAVRIAAGLLARHGDAHPAPGEFVRRVRTLRRWTRGDAAHDGGAAFRPRRNIEKVGLTPDRAQPLAGTSGRRMAVAEGLREVANARPAVEADDLGTTAGLVLIGTHQDLAAGRMLQLVGGKLGRDDGEAAEVILAEADVAAGFAGFAPHLGNLALIGN